MTLYFTKPCSVREIGLTDIIFSLSISEEGITGTLNLLRRMQKTNLEIGKCKVVHQYGHTRYSYGTTADGHISVVFIPASALIQPISLIVGPFWFKTKYGIQQRFDESFINRTAHT